MKRLILCVLAFTFSAALHAATPSPTDLNAWFESGFYERFFAEAHARAERGDAQALFLLGKAHHLGQGVDFDLTKAREYYQAASKLAHPHALNNLGTLLLDEDHKPRDALKLFEQAEAMGIYMPATQNASRIRKRFCELGELAMCLSEAAQYAKWWEQMGHVELLQKAVAAYTKACEVERHVLERLPHWAEAPESIACPDAIRFTERAASTGSGLAAYELGILLYWAKRHIDAAHWFRVAHERGSTDATLALADMTEHGEGVEKSDAAALELAQLAEKKGAPQARYWIEGFWERRAHSGYDRERIAAALAELAKLTPERSAEYWAGTSRLALLNAIAKNAATGALSQSARITPKVCPMIEAGDSIAKTSWAISALGTAEDIDRSADEMPALGAGETDKSGCIQLQPAVLRKVRTTLQEGQTPVLRLEKYAVIFNLIEKERGKLHVEAHTIRNILAKDEMSCGCSR